MATGPTPSTQSNRRSTAHSGWLYQLFKNAVLLSLARQKLSSFNDPVADAIFQALAIASMKEAQRTVLHIFGYHGIELGQQRELLLDVMKYAQKGGLDHVTLPKAPHDLDGLFLTRFEDAIPATRAANLDKLYRDKPLMVKSAMAFIVIFLSFLDDPQYHIAGICDGGILADP
ncbi:MAG: hypothetical protein MUF54_19060 [Polyangiaceae bacterium]|nr:hypothetical protein [Polyangiaceae bacterium]